MLEPFSDDKNTTYQSGINLVFGFNYVINERLVLGAELLPGFSYVTGTQVQKSHYNYNGQYNDPVEEIRSDIFGFYYGLSNTSALLSMAYRF